MTDDETAALVARFRARPDAPGHYHVSEAASGTVPACTCSGCLHAETSVLIRRLARYELGSAAIRAELRRRA